MELRDEIVKRAEKLFMKLGIKSVTMDDIARELGISKKTLYQHFDKKDQLVEQVILSHNNESHCKMISIHQHAENALDEIRQMGAYIIDKVKDVSPSVLYDLRKYYRKVWELMTTKQDEHVIGCMKANLLRGIHEGLFRDDMNVEIVARIYAKAAYTIVDELANSSSEFTRRELIRELHDYHVHAIATPKGLKLWQQYVDDIHYKEPISE
ncbi:MAG: TetR/AcrR family transcriptional regulator [Saprospiraceae bacterium]|jgi:AcrR family transcriptional regulator